MEMTTNNIFKNIGSLFKLYLHDLLRARVWTKYQGYLSIHFLK